MSSVDKLTELFNHGFILEDEYRSKMAVLEKQDDLTQGEILKELVNLKLELAVFKKKYEEDTQKLRIIEIEELKLSSVAAASSLLFPPSSTTSFSSFSTPSSSTSSAPFPAASSATFPVSSSATFPASSTFFSSFKPVPASSAAFPASFSTPVPASSAPFTASFSTPSSTTSSFSTPSSTSFFPWQGGSASKNIDKLEKEDEDEEEEESTISICPPLKFTTKSVGSSIKLALIGDTGVGKTCFVTRQLTGEFERNHRASPGCNVQTLSFQTTYGPIKVNAWDTPGDPNFAALVEGYWIGTDCAIIMFDLTSRQSYKNVPIWYNRLTRVAPNIPVVICGNKVDEKDRKVKPAAINFHRRKGLQYYDISAKSLFNLNKPIVWLLKQLFNNDIELDEMPALMPPTIELSRDLIEKYTKELEEAASLALTAEDSDF